MNNIISIDSFLNESESSLWVVSGPEGVIAVSKNKNVMMSTHRHLMRDVDPLDDAAYTITPYEELPEWVKDDIGEERMKVLDETGEVFI